MRLIARLKIALHLRPRVALFTLPAAPKLAGAFRLRILRVGRGRAERIGQRALLDAAGRIAHRMVDIQAPTGDHRQQLAVIPQGRAVVAFAPHHHQPFRVQRRFPFQVAAKFRRQHRRLPLLQRGAIFLQRRGGQIAQPTGAHLIAIAVGFGGIDIKIGCPVILLNHRDQRLVLIADFSKYV